MWQRLYCSERDSHSVNSSVLVAEVEVDILLRCMQWRKEGCNRPLFSLLQFTIFEFLLYYWTEFEWYLFYFIQCERVWFHVNTIQQSNSSFLTQTVWKHLHIYLNLYNYILTIILSFYCLHFALCYVCCTLCVCYVCADCMYTVCIMFIMWQTVWR